MLSLLFIVALLPLPPSILTLAYGLFAGLAGLFIENINANASPASAIAAGLIGAVAAFAATEAFDEPVDEEDE